MKTIGKIVIFFILGSLFLSITLLALAFILGIDLDMMVVLHTVNIVLKGIGVGVVLFCIVVFFTAITLALAQW